MFSNPAGFVCNLKIKQNGNESKPRAGTACATHGPPNHAGRATAGHRTDRRSRHGTGTARRTICRATRPGTTTATATRTTRRTALRPQRSGADDPPPDGRLFRPGIRPAFRKAGRRHAPQRCRGLRPADGRARNAGIRLDSGKTHPAVQDAVPLPEGHLHQSLYPAVELYRIELDAVPLLRPQRG